MVRNTQEGERAAFRFFLVLLYCFLLQELMPKQLEREISKALWRTQPGP